jgi:hypothetical protein
MAYKAYVQNRDKGENIKALEKWCDNYDFNDWDSKVTETLSLVYGLNYCPIAYVIWPDKPAGWDPAVNAVNDYKRLMYQLPLNGIAFEQDNETVFSLTASWPWYTPRLRLGYMTMSLEGMAMGQCKPSAIIMKVKQNWMCRHQKPSKSWTPWYTGTRNK